MSTGTASPQSNEFAAGAEAALKTAVHLLIELQTRVQKASPFAPSSPPAGQQAERTRGGRTGRPRGVAAEAGKPRP